MRSFKGIKKALVVNDVQVVFYVKTHMDDIVPNNIVGLKLDAPEKKQLYLVWHIPATIHGFFCLCDTSGRHDAPTTWQVFVAGLRVFSALIRHFLAFS